MIRYPVDRGFFWIPDNRFALSGMTPSLFFREKRNSNQLLESPWHYLGPLTVGDIFRANFYLNVLELPVTLYFLSRQRGGIESLQAL